MFERMDSSGRNKFSPKLISSRGDGERKNSETIRRMLSMFASSIQATE